MRENFFRGKRVDNGKWIEGSLIQKGEETFIVQYLYLIGKVHETSWEEFCFGGFIEVVPETVGQYTGLTDKNGTRVFEGDILKIIHKYQSPFDDDTKEYTDIDADVVHFDDEGLCFSYGKSPFLCVVDNVTAEYEIIGNIHDNPELLEGKS